MVLNFAPSKGKTETFANIIEGSLKVCVVEHGGASW